MNNKRGFTLIELLAVIVILGILMMVAIPMMTSYIENSKKDAFAQNAGTYIDQARNSMLSSEYNCSFPSPGKYVIVPTNIMDLEKGNNISPYGGNMNTTSYVLIANIGTATTKDIYVYYYAGTDKNKNGISEYTQEGYIKRTAVKKGEAIDPPATGSMTLKYTDKNGNQTNKTVTLGATCS